MGFVIIIRDSRGTRLLSDVDGVVATYGTEAEARIWAERLASCPGVEVLGVNYLD